MSANMGEHDTVSLCPALRVTIRGDLELLLDMLDAIVRGDLPLPLRGGYSDGLHGNGEKWFHLAYRERVEQWFHGRGKSWTEEGDRIA